MNVNKMEQRCVIFSLSRIFQHFLCSAPEIYLIELFVDIFDLGKRPYLPEKSRICKIQEKLVKFVEA